MSALNIYRESIQEFRLPHHTIRVWREASKDLIAPRHDDDVSELVSTIGTTLCGLTLEGIANEILQLPRVNAVEVKDRACNGCVYYKDWP